MSELGSDVVDDTSWTDVWETSANNLAVPVDCALKEGLPPVFSMDSEGVDLALGSSEEDV